MRRESRHAGLSRSGAASKPLSERDNQATPNSFYLPDLCAPLAVLGVVLISELVAIVFTLAGQSGWPFFFQALARTSLFFLWMGLTAAALLCSLRPWLSRFSTRVATLLTVLAVTLNIVLVSEAIFWLGYFWGPHITGDVSGWFPANHLFFLSRNIAVGMLVLFLVLRYFYIADQWQTNVQREAEARIHALQARIRPHFLFNSMNTIAALTRTNPAAAEEAVEDLADLFRASLNVSDEKTQIKQELETTRIYQRMEQQRLGERLVVEWDVDSLPMRARIPALTIQPLVENAIYHGVEPLPGRGIVTIDGHQDGDMIYVSVSNPVPRSGTTARRGGNQIALGNIRERLKLAFDGRATLDVVNTGEHYQVTICFPYQE